MRPAVYILPDRPWWADAIAAALGVLPVVAALLVALFFAGCGDNVDCPPADVPPACVPASGAALNTCGYDIDRGGVSYPAAGCTGFVQNDGCTVPVNLAKPRPDGRSLVDALCIPRCEVAR